MMSYVLPAIGVMISLIVLHEGAVRLLDHLIDNVFNRHG